MQSEFPTRHVASVEYCYGIVLECAVSHEARPVPYVRRTPCFGPSAGWSKVPATRIRRRAARGRAALPGQREGLLAWTARFGVRAVHHAARLACRTGEPAKSERRYAGVHQM